MLQCDDAIEYILEKEKEVSIDSIVEGLRMYAARCVKTDLLRAGILQAAKLIEVGKIR